MLSAGCKADTNTASVLNCIQTEALNDDIKNLVSSDMRTVDACDYLTAKEYDFYGIEAFFIEAGHPDSINDSLELVKKVRLVNHTACIFILATNSKTFSSVNYYLAGADHCIKLPSDADEKTKLLSRTLDDSHWKKTTQLFLDRTRLLLSSSTNKLEISYTEMTIIDALLRAPNHALSQDDIAKTLDPNIVFYDPRALEKTISRLRTKIKKSYSLELIFSVRAFGYRLRRGTVSA